MQVFSSIEVARNEYESLLWIANNKVFRKKTAIDVTIRNMTGTPHRYES